jgi:hypothetical protein
MEQVNLRRSETQLTEAFVAGFVTPATYRSKQAELQERLKTLTQACDTATTAIEQHGRIDATLSQMQSIASLYDVFDD